MKRKAMATLKAALGRGARETGSVVGEGSWRYRALLVLAAVLLVIGLSGCGAVDYGFDAEPAEAPPAMDRAEEAPSPGGRGEVEAAQGVRYIIRNAQLSLEVQDLDQAVREIQAETERLRGYVSYQEIYTLSGDRRAGNITLRIPADAFEEALEALKPLGRIKNEQFDTDDVTRQYIDMEARITNLAAQEERLRELLEKAETIEDILQVESELGRVRGDLEAMEGDFRYLRERVRYSTFQLRLEERDPRTQAISNGAGSWDNLGDLLLLNTNRLFRGVTGFLVWFIGSLPILIPLGLLVFLGHKVIVSRRKRKEKKKKEQQSLPG